jgi:hypothetical protein
VSGKLLFLSHFFKAASGACEDTFFLLEEDLLEGRSSPVKSL